MPAPRIGVTQRVVDLPDRNERRDVLDQRWAPLLASRGWLVVPIPNGLDDPVAHISQLGVDLLVLSGGNDLAHLPDASDAAPERDRTERLLLDHAAEVQMPVLGVCRGMQMLVDHHGAELRRVAGHVAAPHVVATTVDASAWALVDGREVNSFHGWGLHVDGLGPDLDVLATAPDGTVEAVCHRTLPQVGIMWHPERAVEHPADLDLVAALLAAAGSTP